jgi:Glycine-zipper domain
MGSPSIFLNRSPARSDPRGQQTMKKFVIALVALGFLSGCADMNSTQQRAATGTLGGAAGGAIIGAIAGNAGLGAAIGAGAGLIGGLVYDKVKRDEQSAYQQGYQSGRASQAN